MTQIKFFPMRFIILVIFMQISREYKVVPRKQYLTMLRMYMTGATYAGFVSS